MSDETTNYSGNDFETAGALRTKKIEENEPIDKAAKMAANAVIPVIGGAVLKGLNFFGVSNKTIIFIAVGFVLFFMLLVFVCIYELYGFWIDLIELQLTASPVV